MYGGMKQPEFERLMEVISDRPIAYHPLLAKLLGSATAGIYLSQILYWTPRTKDPDGWFYKTEVEFTDETGLSRREQETARKKLSSLGLLDVERKGIPAKLYYRIQQQRLIEFITEQTSCAKRTNKDGGNAQQLVQNEQTITETTSEITSEKHKESKGLLTVDQRVELIIEFAPKLGGQLRTIEIVNEAMAHKNSDRWKSQYRYLRGWLRREAEKFNGSGGSNGAHQQGVEHDPDPENTRRVAAIKRSYPAGKYGG